MHLTDWGQRAVSLLERLSDCSEPGPGVTRLPYTPEHRAALDVLRAAMEGAGLAVSLDAAGTLVGRRDGPPGSKCLLVGSHQDSVRQGGAYDGIMGVVLPILALEKLQVEGANLPCTIEILAFADEEGVRFPTALTGSRAVAGTFDLSVLDMRDSEGCSLRDAMESFGLDPDQIAGLSRDQADVLGFLEAHIEQGPLLEEEDEAIGIVTAICGIERHQIVVTGETGHAGTLPMAGRRDALVGAAAIVSEVDRLGQTTADLRATVGALSVEPNVVNAVPQLVRMSAEFRSPSDETRSSAGQAIQAFAQELAAKRNLKIEVKKTYSQMAQPCDINMSHRLTRAAQMVGASGLQLPSGATHDASAFADLCPIAMLFVRCRDGVSHKPEEYASPEDMELAISVLSQFLKSV